MSSDSTWLLTVRLSGGDRLAIELPSSASVQECKEKIATTKAELEANRQRLVYKGRILEDNSRSLSDYGVVNQATLFLVMSSNPGSGQPPKTGGATTSNASSGQSSYTTASTTANSATATINPWQSAAGRSMNSSNPFVMGGGAGFPNMNNPPSMEQMQQMMNSPMMQSMMDNPEMMRTAMQMSMQQNPQLRSLMESNPELRQMFNDPAMLDQAIQMMRNPAYMQQQMRNQELAMSQLENLPGGFSALSNMYRSVQEPLMDAQTEGQSNSTSSNNGRNSTGDGATGAAMPNPWGSPSTNTTPTSLNALNTSSSRSFSVPNPTSNPWAAAMGEGTAGGMPLMMNPQNMDPNQLMAILDNPMLQQMMRQMVDQNPDMIRQMLEAQNPMLRQLFQTNPEMGNQMVRQMMNPQALRSMLQMQQAMGGASPLPMASVTGGTPSGGLDFTNLLGGNATGTTATGNAAIGSNPLDLSSFMQQLQGMQGFGPQPGPMMGASLPSDVHPADRYRSQLQSLRDMGFDDEQQCLTVLQQYHGNLNRAVDALLMDPSSSNGGSTAPASSPPPSSSPASRRNSSSSKEPDEPKDATEKKND